MSLARGGCLIGSVALAMFSGYAFAATLHATWKSRGPFLLGMEAFLGAAFFLAAVLVGDRAWFQEGEPQ